MIKKDLIIAAVIVGIFIAEVVFAGKAGAVIGGLNFLCGGFAMWYYFMRKGVLG